MSHLKYVNVLLKKFAEANDGVNHVSDYCLDELPLADSMMRALKSYFSAMSTSITPPQAAERWKICTTKLTDSRPRIRTVANHWFYEQEFSPSVDAAAKDRTLNDFMSRLHSVVGASTVFEVQVNPPMWYECVWQDFAFDGNRERWLLHFGFSD